MSAPPFAVRDTPQPQVIEMPGWRPILRQVLTRALLVSLLPMAVFYTTLTLFGLRPAALTTAALYYAGLLTRIVRHRPVLAAALFTAGLLALRTVVVCCTGSAFLYFIQPVAGTVGVATAFAATAFAGRPVVDRLAHDFCPFSTELSARLREARFFNRVSVVWALAYGMNAVGTVWLLTNASLGGFLVIKAVAGPIITWTAAVTSFLVFRATVRQQNVQLRWAHHQRWRAVPGH
jgi:hypothetical protein